MPDNRSPNACAENTDARGSIHSSPQIIKNPGLSERILIRIGQIESLSFSLIKIFVLIIFAIFLYKSAAWVAATDEGFSIQPFETSGIGKGIDGTSISQLLYSELERIKEIDQKATETIRSASSADIDQIAPPAVIPPQSERPSSRSGLISYPYTQMMPGDYGFLAPKGESLKYTISGMGSVAVAGNQFSPGSLLLFLKEIMGSTPCPMTGRIQKYGDNVIIIATLEDRKSGVVSTWEVRRIITGDNESIQSEIPSLIRELSFHIAPDLGRRWQPKIDFPEVPDALEYQTMAQEAYLDYNMTWNTSSLDFASDLAFEAIKKESGYDKPAEMLFRIGFHNIEKNRWDEAEKIFSNLCAVRPFLGSMGLGAVYIRLGQYGNASNEFDNATIIDEKSAPAWSGRGDALYFQGKLDEALKSYDNAIKSDPNFAEAWRCRGVALCELGNAEEALRSYDKALKLNLESVDSWTGRGDALHNLERYDEAIESYDEAIKLDHKYATAWNNKGYTLYIQGNFEDAMEALNKSIELEPESAMSWNNLGNVFLDQGKLDEAIDSYNKSIKFDPKLVYAWVGRGIVFYEQGKINESLKNYEEAIRLDQKMSYAWAGRGNALYKQGNIDEAIKSYHKAKELDPDIAVPEELK